MQRTVGQPPSTDSSSGQQLLRWDPHVRELLLRGELDEAARLSSAALHDALRKYKQTVTPLFPCSATGSSPMKDTTHAFVMRVTRDVVRFADQCIQVLRAEGDVRDEKRRCTLCQVFDIPHVTQVPVAKLFLDGLIKKMSADASQSLTDLVLTSMVPASTVIATASIMWLQQHYECAQEVLWKHAIEEVLSISEDASAAASSSSSLRTVVIFGGEAVSSMLRAKLLGGALELWAACSASEAAVRQGLDEIALIAPAVLSTELWVGIQQRTMAAVATQRCRGGGALQQGLSASVSQRAKMFEHKRRLLQQQPSPNDGVKESSNTAAGSSSSAAVVQQQQSSISSPTRAAVSPRASVNASDIAQNWFHALQRLCQGATARLVMRVLLSVIVTIVVGWLARRLGTRLLGARATSRMQGRPGAAAGGSSGRRTLDI